MADSDNGASQGVVFQRKSSLPPAVARRLAVLLVACVAGLHFMVMPAPQDPSIFDEAAYVPIARDLLHGKGGNNEHPPLAKLLMAGGIRVLGDNPLGWRLVPAAAGTASIWLIYAIGASLFSPTVGLTAAVLLALDNMYFVISSAALLDPYGLFFLLLGGWLCVRQRSVAAGIAWGCALLCKMTALFWLAGVGLWAALVMLGHLHAGSRLGFVASLRRSALVAAVCVGVFLAGLGIYNGLYPDAQFGSPFGRVAFMMTYQSGIGEEGEPNPLLWLVSFHPSFYHVQNVPAADGQSARTLLGYVGYGTMPIWWGAWIGVAFAVWRIVRHGYDDAKPIGAALACFLVPFALFVGMALKVRVAYAFYFVWCLPALCILLAVALNHCAVPRWVRWAYVVTCLAWFVKWFPLRAMI